MTPAVWELIDLAAREPSAGIDVLTGYTITTEASANPPRPWWAALPTMEGDGTALFASNLLTGTGVAVTRLARGLPSGSSLELANAQMLADALDGRRTF